LEDQEAGKLEKFHSDSKEKGDDSGAKKVEYKEVEQLTVDTYKETLANNDYVLVEYYSPKCGHCIRFAGEYEALAREQKEKGSKFVIAAVDMAKEVLVGDWVTISGYPTFRFYIKGVELDYKGERKADAILEFMEKAASNRLQTAESVEGKERPFVTISGIDEKSPLQYLNIKFTKYPIYLLPASEFKVEIYDETYSSYSGDTNIDAVANWLIEKTEDVIVQVANPVASKKLEKALSNQTPLLIIINRDNSTAFSAAFSFLESFCENKVEFTCGVASKGDQEYDQFNEWISDPKNEKSRLIYLLTDKFEKYLWEGDLAQLDAQAVEQFIKDVKEGKIQANQPEKAPEAASEEVQQAEQTQEQPKGEILETEEPVQEQAAETAEPVEPIAEEL
jgi:thiol-disulfide isomerase/thioredoxin